MNKNIEQKPGQSLGISVNANLHMISWFLPKTSSLVGHGLEDRKNGMDCGSSDILSETDHRIIWFEFLFVPRFPPDPCPASRPL